MDALSAGFSTRLLRVRLRNLRGGASAYLAKLVRDDELREAGEQMAAWYAAHPTYVEDALIETAAALNEAN